MISATVPVVKYLTIDFKMCYFSEKRINIILG